MGKIYCCPKCRGRTVRYVYCIKIICCKNCGVPLRDFQLDRKELVLQGMLPENHAPVVDTIGDAIKQVKSKRLFNSERAFRGQLQANLDKMLRERNLISNHVLVEEEYQKRKGDHGISHRPDLIIHIPIETGLTKTRKEGNFVAFELKLRANQDDVAKDLRKLDDYINVLNYSLGIFVNIDGKESFNVVVSNDRMHVFNVVRTGERVKVMHSYLKNGRTIRQKL